MDRHAGGLAIVALSCVAFFWWYGASHALTLHTTDDTYINLNKPNQTNGQAEKIVVRNTGTVGERQAFVKFDLSVLPAGAEVSQAVLRLWVDKLQNPGSFELREVLATWDEATLSAGTAPVLSQAFSTIPIPNNKDSFVIINITSVVQGWLDSPSSNFGLALIPDSDDPLRMELDSKEDVATSHPMELEVALVSDGKAGPPGPQGDPGPAGLQGLQGAQGIQGEAGLQGAQGLSGAQGLPGQPGVDGFPGMDGSKWLTGSGSPDSALGNIGDSYLDAVSGDYYEKTNLSTWALASNLRGPEGSTGVDGAQGQQGLPGNIGPQGPIGLTGPQGAVGTEGPTGPQGLPGNLVLANQLCPSGQMIIGFDGSGNIVCAVPGMDPPPPPPPPPPPSSNRMASANFAIRTLVISAAGGTQSSNSYTLRASALGQGGSATMSSTQYIVHTGIVPQLFIP